MAASPGITLVEVCQRPLKDTAQRGHVRISAPGDGRPAFTQGHRKQNPLEESRYRDAFSLGMPLGDPVQIGPKREIHMLLVLIRFGLGYHGNSGYTY